MIEGVAVRAGWSASGEIRQLMSPGLLARVTAADAQDAAAAERAEREHRARWQVRHEQVVDEAARQLAVEQGIPLREAVRQVGRTKAEALSYYSAVQDLEDARQEAAQASLMRRLAVDAGLLDVSAAEPSERAVELAARTMRDDASPEDVGRALRRRFLRRNYQAME